MEILFSIIFLLIGLGSLYYARRQIKIAREERIRARIDNIVTTYLEMERAHLDSGLSAFLKCDVAELASDQLEAAANRIRLNTGIDPLVQIREPLKSAGVDLRKFFEYVKTKRIKYKDLADIQKILGEMKPN